MGGKPSKTTPNRLRGAQRSHFCPTCDGPAKFYKHVPCIGSRTKGMFGHCDKGHVHRKTELILR